MSSLQTQQENDIARDNINQIIAMWPGVDDINRFMEAIGWQRRDRIALFMRQGDDLHLPAGLHEFLVGLCDDLDVEEGWVKSSGGGADPRKDRFNKLEKLKKQLKEAALGGAIGALEIETPKNKKNIQLWDTFFDKLSSTITPHIAGANENVKNSVESTLGYINAMHDEYKANRLSLYRVGVRVANYDKPYLFTQNRVRQHCLNLDIIV